MNMFCYQCQETAKGSGCTIKGVCGKEPQLSNLMDKLIFVLRGIAILDQKLKENGKANHKVGDVLLDGLFSTITNANFDSDAMHGKLRAAIQLKQEMIEDLKKANIPIPEYEEVTTTEFGREEDPRFSVLSEKNEDVRALKQLITYGIKGAAAYLEHASNLGYKDQSIVDELENGLMQISRKDIGMDELVKLVLSIGQTGVRSMALLDKANTSAYGNPEITEVNIGVGTNPGILVSGHDLKDLAELLEQTKDTGVDVYTHSEMLPAHYYPYFKKYTHFKGNYGNAWWKQKAEFESFNGAILFTTNCIVPPLQDATYTKRIFTTNSAGLAGAQHISNRVNGKPKDFSPVIACAKQCNPPTEIEKGSIIGGFAHHQTLALADKIIEAVKSGAIRKFIVMAGCDGRMPSRKYYTEFAEKLPKDTVILTAGCAKYRYNKLNLGKIGDIPRVLDAGQCNDSYSLVKIAMALRDAFKLKDINELPIVYNIAWYEQKAVIVLLALLSLNVKRIHLGPTLPAFVTPAILDVLVKRFNISTIKDVDNDIAMMTGQLIDVK